MPLLSDLISIPRWLYHEFGIASVWQTGRDAWLIILARTCRMFAFGSASLIIALFFSALEFNDWQIGLFMTLTLLGDVLLSGFLALVADRIGRRKILFSGAILMTISGAVFMYFENFWILLLAAVVGVISASGGDFGPFRSIEEAIISGITKPETRSDVLSWYVTTSSIGSAAGTELSGRMVDFLRHHAGWTITEAYHVIFGFYLIMGLANVGFAFLLSDRCELSTNIKQKQAVKTEASEHLLREDESSDHEEESIKPAPTDQRKIKTISKTSLFAQISSTTRSTMYKLWALLIADSIADGMVSYSLTNYYLDRKFSLSRSTLGDITSAAYLLASISTIFAGPLAKRLGLINTMVFTHVPSSAAVLFFPAPSNLVLTVILFFIRTGLNNMDQAPRTAFIAAVVKEDERTAVMGITGMLRTLAAAGGPFITGLLAGSDLFWIAFVGAGVLRLAYDFGLWALFVGVDVRGVEEDRRKESARVRGDGGDIADDEEEGGKIGRGHGIDGIDGNDDDGVELEMVERRTGYVAPQTPGFQVER